jgi:hypothetical protein
MQWIVYGSRRAAPQGKHAIFLWHWPDGYAMPTWLGIMASEHDFCWWETALRFGVAQKALQEHPQNTHSRTFVRHRLSTASQFHQETLLSAIS